MDKQITQKTLQAYGAYLRREEKSAATREKYLRDAGSFARWLEGRPVTRDAVAEWKGHLLELRYAPTTVNTALAALNSLGDGGGRQAHHGQGLGGFRFPGRPAACGGRADCHPVHLFL